MRDSNSKNAKPDRPASPPPAKASRPGRPSAPAPSAPKRDRPSAPPRVAIVDNRPSQPPPEIVRPGRPSESGPTSAGRPSRPGRPFSERSDWGRGATVAKGSEERPAGSFGALLGIAFPSATERRIARAEQRAAEQEEASQNGQYTLELLFQEDVWGRRLELLSHKRWAAYCAEFPRPTEETDAQAAENAAAFERLKATIPDAERQRAVRCLKTAEIIGADALARLCNLAMSARVEVEIPDLDPDPDPPTELELEPDSDADEPVPAPADRVLPAAP